MSRGRSLESLKQRISDMKIKIDETEEREENAKAALLLTQERQLKNETEIRSLSNRYETLDAELKRVTGVHTNTLSQLDQNAVRSEQCESNRKQLQEKEEEDFETARKTEENAKTTKYDLEEKENRQKESSLRETALANDLKRVEDRHDKALRKVEELEKQNSDIVESTEELENKVNALHEKEDDFKEKINFLNEQIKQVTALEDERVAKIKTSQRMKEQLEEELRREKEKLQEIEKQFEEIASDVM